MKQKVLLEEIIALERELRQECAVYYSQYLSFRGAGDRETASVYYGECRGVEEAADKLASFIRRNKTPDQEHWAVAS